MERDHILEPGEAVDSVAASLRQKIGDLLEETLEPWRHLIEIGELFEEVLESRRPLIVSHEEDDEERLGEYRFSVIKEGVSTTFAGPSLLEALQAVVYNRKSKRCQHCEKMLPLSHFQAKQNSIDGLLYWCRDCERKRLSKWYPRKKRKQGRLA